MKKLIPLFLILFVSAVHAENFTEAEVTKIQKRVEVLIWKKNLSNLDPQS